MLNKLHHDVAHDSVTQTDCNVRAKRLIGPSVNRKNRQMSIKVAQI